MTYTLSLAAHASSRIKHPTDDQLPQCDILRGLISLVLSKDTNTILFFILLIIWISFYCFFFSISLRGWQFVWHCVQCAEVLPKEPLRGKNVISNNPHCFIYVKCMSLNYCILSVTEDVLINNKTLFSEILYLLREHNMQC